MTSLVPTAGASFAMDDLPALIRQADLDARAAFGAGIAHAIRAGQLLSTAKEQVGHGQWLAWLTINCPEISERSAQRYMQVFREIPKLKAADPANATRVSDLTFRGALDLISANSEAARKIPDADRPEVLEAVADKKLANLTDAQEQYQSRKTRERAKTIAARRIATVAKQRNAEYPTPQPEKEIDFCGLDEDALQVVVDALKQHGDWYHQLAERLNTCYEPRLPELAMAAVNAIYALRERLGYSRDTLLHTVASLRDLLTERPHHGNEIAAWRKKANVTTGLLILAAKLIQVVVRGKGALYSLARTSVWALPNDPRIADYIEPDGKPIENTEGRWQRRKGESR